MSPSKNWHLLGDVFIIKNTSKKPVGLYQIVAQTKTRINTVFLGEKHLEF